MTSAGTTTDPAIIRRWVEARDGRPAAVVAAHDKHGSNILSIDFDETADGLEPISWDEFFAKFDEAGLAFLHQERTCDGAESRFFKLVPRGNGAMR